MQELLPLLNYVRESFSMQSEFSEFNQHRNLPSGFEQVWRIGLDVTRHDRLRSSLARLLE